MGIVPKKLSACWSLEPQGDVTGNTSMPQAICRWWYPAGWFMAMQSSAFPVSKAHDLLPAAVCVNGEVLMVPRAKVGCPSLVVFFSASAPVPCHTTAQGSSSFCYPELRNLPSCPGQSTFGWMWCRRRVLPKKKKKKIIWGCFWDPAESWAVWGHCPAPWLCPHPPQVPLTIL